MDKDLWQVKPLHYMDLRKNSTKYKTPKHLDTVRKIQHYIDIVILRILYLKGWQLSVILFLR